MVQYFACVSIIILILRMCFDLLLCTHFLGAWSIYTSQSTFAHMGTPRMFVSDSNLGHSNLGLSARCFFSDCPSIFWYTTRWSLSRVVSRPRPIKSCKGAGLHPRPSRAVVRTIQRFTCSPKPVVPHVRTFLKKIYLSQPYRYESLALRWRFEKRKMGRAS